MAGLVLDGSVVLAVALQGTNRHLAVAIMTRVADEGAAVPGIWHLEVGNILLMTERRQKISAARVAELEDLARLPRQSLE